MLRIAGVWKNDDTKGKAVYCSGSFWSLDGGINGF